MRPAAAALVATALLGSACQPQPPEPPSARPSPPPPKAAPAAQPAAHAANQTWFKWNADDDGSPRTYQAGPFQVTADKQATKGLLRPKLTIVADGGPPLVLAGSGGSASAATAEFGAMTLDRQASGPQLLVRTFTYGAHCCFVYRLVERLEGRWMVHELGQFDAAGMPTPQDVDGDGRLELAAGDQAFLYAFESYAGSNVPPRVYEVAAGKLADVTGQARFRPHLEAKYRELLADCRESHRRGACGPAAALAARLGRLNEIWPLVDAAEPASEPFLDNETIEGRTVTFPSFRAHLEWFLGEQGYLPKQPLPKAAAS